jgi:dihydrofolate reductase
MPLAQTLHLTRVHASPTGDVYFPALATAHWREIGRVEHTADELHAFAMSFVTLQRSTGVRPAP